MHSKWETPKRDLGVYNINVGSHNAFVSGYVLAAEDVLNDIEQTSTLEELKVKWLETLESANKAYR